jgi:hypothetical protein
MSCEIRPLAHEYSEVFPTSLTLEAISVLDLPNDIREIVLHLQLGTRRTATSTGTMTDVLSAAFVKVSRSDSVPRDRGYGLSDGGQEVCLVHRS